MTPEEIEAKKEAAARRKALKPKVTGITNKRTIAFVWC